MRINKLYRAISAFALGLALVACSEANDYTPATPEDSSKTYVSVDMSAARTHDVDGADIVVPFVRNNDSGELEVPIYIDDPSGLFKLASNSVKFANGQKTANAVVSYSYDALVPETIYDFAVGISASEYASEYRPIALPLSCKKAWQNLGMAQFYDDWWTGGPFEKQLLKSPDGSELYRLINPWDKKSVEEGGLDFVSEVPYLEFAIDENGAVTYADVLNMGFTFSGMTCHMLHPSKRNDAEGVAKNAVIMDKLVQFCWYPILDYDGSSFRWWGVTSVAYISFPGGPDLNALLQ